MSRSRAVHWFVCFVLLFGVVAGLVGNQVLVAAQQDNEEPPLEEKIELDCKYPVLRGESGEGFEFEVKLNYQGNEVRRFELATTAPLSWRAQIMTGYDGKEVTTVELEPGTYPETLKVRLSPASREALEPGEYVVTLEVSSGSIKDAIELKAVVTAKYEMLLSTETGRLNTEVTAGKDNHVSILIVNTGTAAIDNISFSSSKPGGWNITFNPAKVESLEPGLIQEVDVVINPPEKTIAGDYAVTLRAESKRLYEKLEFRVTVLTPTIWGWVGILIVVIVIAGLGVLFWQLGRR